MSPISVYLRCNSFQKRVTTRFARDAARALVQDGLRDSESADHVLQQQLLNPWLAQVTERVVLVVPTARRVRMSRSSALTSDA